MKFIKGWVMIIDSPCDVVIAAKIKELLDVIFD